MVPVRRGLPPAEVDEDSTEVVGVLLHPVVERLDLLLVQEPQHVLLKCSRPLARDDLHQRSLRRDGFVDHGPEGAIDLLATVVDVMHVQLEVHRTILLLTGHAVVQAAPVLRAGRLDADDQRLDARICRLSRPESQPRVWPSAPEDASRVAVNFGQQLVDVRGRCNEVVLLEAQVAVAPVQRPRASGLRIAQSRDREAGPLGAQVFTPGSAPLDDGQVSWLDLAFDANLMTGVFGNTLATPALNPKHGQLRQRGGWHDVQYPTAARVPLVPRQAPQLRRRIAPAGAAARPVIEIWRAGSATQA